MPRMVDGSLLGAVKHPANHKPLIFCSMSMVAVGMLMVVFGGVIMLLDHVEMGPPHFDSQYERYAGSSLAHILGPLSIALGFFTIAGSVFILSCATVSYYKSRELYEKKQRQTLNLKRSKDFYDEC